MLQGLRPIIEQLERQKSAIEQALSTLREVEGFGDSSALDVNSARTTKPRRKKRGLSADGRRRIAEAQRKRWAVARKSAKNSVTTEKTINKRGRRKVSRPKHSVVR